jgi:rare lipoprotein A
MEIAFMPRRSAIRKWLAVPGVAGLVGLAAGCGSERPIGPVDPVHPSYVETGAASWYGKSLAGRKTASGETFDPRDLTAAHRTLPFGSTVKVTNLANGRSVVVRINDRGPFKPGRVIDCSEAAAIALGFHRHGLTRVAIDWPEDASPPVPPVASRKARR